MCHWSCAFSRIVIHSKCSLSDSSDKLWFETQSSFASIYPSPPINKPINRSNQSGPSLTRSFILHLNSNCFFTHMYRILSPSLLLCHFLPYFAYVSFSFPFILPICQYLSSFMDCFCLLQSYSFISSSCSMLNLTIFSHIKFSSSL